MLKKPIFILGSHKSGTSLLRNLFDGHSEVFTNPIETHFFRHFGDWVKYEYSHQKFSKRTNKEIKDSLLSTLKAVNQRNNPLADSQVKGLFDIEKFTEKINLISNKSSRKEIIELYIKALFYSIYHKELDENKRIVHKAVGLGEFAQELRFLFPDAKFIHIVRNPYANFTSLRKFYTKYGKYPLIQRMVASLENNYYHLLKNKDLLPNYHVVKYEELVTNPEDVVRELCNFTELQFESSLTNPTSAGKNWKGNSTTGMSFNKIENKHLDAWKETIHPLEVHYVNRNFDHILEYFDYPYHTSNKSKFLPIKKENAIRYIYNRLYMAYNRFYKNW